jgi:four helix bundle protein
MASREGAGNSLNLFHKFDIFNHKKTLMLNLSHKNLEVYKFSLELVKEIYKHTKLFPKEEQFVLVTQLRRAAISVSSNLAEGAARLSSKEKKRFYEIARASLVEIDTQMEISLMLEYLRKENIVDFEKCEESVFRMLSKMISNFELKIPLAKPH